MEYNQEYKDARKERREKNESKKCEYTGEPGRRETHHSQPLSIGGANTSSNLIDTQSHFHAYLHSICNVDDAERFTKRKKAARAYWQNPLGSNAEEQKRIIRVVDETLIDQWVENLLTKFHGELQERVGKLTVVRGMETVRDQNMEIHALRARIKQLEEENAALRTKRVINPYDL